jgi:putative transposase
MPRQPRIDAPGLIYHTIGRGIERRRIFRDDQDRQAFIDRLAAVLIDTGTPLYAFCLMPNHFHLLLRRTGHPISSVMSRLLTGYALYFNKKHDRVGHLFQNRYKAIVCQEDSYFFELVRYINLNPIRAKLVSTIEDLASYGFSSHPFILGDKTAAWFNGPELLAHFADTGASPREAYVSFLKDGLLQEPDLEGGGLKRSLAITNYPRLKRVSDQRILGDESFVENLLFVTQERRQSESLTDIGAIIVAVCDEHNVTQVELTGKSRRAVIAKARAAAVLRLARETEMSGSQIAETLCLTKSAVSKIVSRNQHASLA